MKFTATEEYGLRCMLQMARCGTSRTASIADIAEREFLSIAYVAKLMSRLRKGGLVNSIRGQKGGYQLTRPPEEITLDEVMAVLGDRLYTEGFCDRYSGRGRKCAHTPDCPIRSLWSGIDQMVYGFLRQYRLSDLLCSESEMVRQVNDRFEALPQLVQLGRAS